MRIQYRLKKERSLEFQEVCRRLQRRQLSHTRKGFIDKSGMDGAAHVSSHQQTHLPLLSFCFPFFPNML